MEIKSRYNEKIYFYLLLASAASFLISLFLLQLFVGFLSILWIFEKMDEKRKAIDVFFSLILIYAVIRLTSVLLSNYPLSSNQSFYKEALFYLGFFSMNFYLKVIDKEKLILTVKIFTIAAVAAAIIGLIKFNFRISDRAESFSSGYAVFSSYLITAAGVLICIKLFVNKKNYLTLKNIGIALIFSGVITSLGRTNIVIACLLFIAAFFLKKIDFKSAGIILFFTIIISGLSFINNSPELGRRIDNPTDLSDRNIILEGAKDLFLKFEHPILGYGPRTFHDIFLYKEKFADKGIGSWHNDFIQVYFESGFLGLTAFIILIYAVFLQSFKLLKNKLNDSYKNIVWGIIFGTAALVLSSLTAGFIDSPVLSVVFVFLISVLSGIKHAAEKRKLPLDFSSI